MDTLDQLLFGYRDGHQLIAGSRSLSPRQQRDVLPHLDANFDHADAQQLVGIGIPSLHAYLLGRIWPAPELPRPGAVWAHALLLSAHQLAHIRLAGLLALLRRPLDDRFDYYSRALPVPQGFEYAPAPPPLARALAWAVGTADGSPRIVLWDNPDEAEGTLVGLLDASRDTDRFALSFRTRERARLRSPYRIQVATAVVGPPGERRDAVIDPRDPPYESRPQTSAA
jgi:hypothetical protein